MLCNGIALRRRDNANFGFEFRWKYDDHDHHGDLDLLKEGEKKKLSFFIQTATQIKKIEFVAICQFTSPKLIAQFVKFDNSTQ